MLGGFNAFLPKPRFVTNNFTQAHSAGVNNLDELKVEMRPPEVEDFLLCADFKNG